MTPTEQEKLRDILREVLFDGQNQIHDLKDGKATPEQITERMFASLDYWQSKLMQLITADRKRVALEARIDELGHCCGKCGVWHSETCNISQRRLTFRERIAELKRELDK